jgi:heme/copper-type cytochrome/quinol oxidase subunit 2
MGTTLTSAQRHAAVERAHGLARLAIGAMLFTSVFAAIVRPEASWLASTFGHWSVFVQIPVSLGSCVLFLVWLYRAVSNARALGAQTKWSPGMAVVASVVPVVSLVMQYFVARDLYRASDPSPLQDAPIFRERADAGYREGGRELLPAPRWDYAAPILAWCLIEAANALTVTVIARIADWVPLAAWLYAPGQIAISVLCALVVRSIDARQRERCRRLEATEATRAGPVGAI